MRSDVVSKSATADSVAAVESPPNLRNMSGASDSSTSLSSGDADATATTMRLEDPGTFRFSPNGAVRRNYWELININVAKVIQRRAAEEAENQFRQKAQEYENVLAARDREQKAKMNSLKNKVDELEQQVQSHKEREELQAAREREHTKVINDQKKVIQSLNVVEADARKIQPLRVLLSISDLVEKGKQELDRASKRARIDENAALEKFETRLITRERFEEMDERVRAVHEMLADYTGGALEARIASIMEKHLTNLSEDLVGEKAKETKSGKQKGTATLEARLKSNMQRRFKDLSDLVEAKAEETKNGVLGVVQAATEEPEDGWFW